MAHVPGVEDLGQGLAPQHVDDPLKLVVEPAHIFHVGIAEHILIFSLAAHVVQRGVQGCHHGVPLAGRHPGQPPAQPLGEEVPVHLEGGAHHLVEIGQVVGRGIGDAPVDDDAGPAGRLVILPQEGGHVAAVAGDPAEKHPVAAPLREGAEAVIQLCQLRQLKHRRPAAFRKNHFAPIITAPTDFFNRCIEHTHKIHKNLTVGGGQKVFPSRGGRAIIKAHGRRRSPGGSGGGRTLRTKEADHAKETDWL